MKHCTKNHHPIESGEVIIDISLNILKRFILLLMVNVTVFANASGFSEEKLPFTVKFKNEVSSYRVMGVFVLPEETLEIGVTDGANRGAYFFEAHEGNLIKEETTKWQWKAPSERKLYPIKIISPALTDTMTLNVFVMVPYQELNGQYLNGYRIGTYPVKPLKQLSIYEPPRGFVEVTADIESTLISPHFQLRQFLCKQAGNYPMYVVLRERLLLKLELILEKVNDKGYQCSTFNVMSGYRTPYYNELIKDVRYSRHVWGGAADIFIDENPKNGMMDDLNNDGKIDIKDATVLYRIIDGMYGETWYEIFVGGLGKYGTTAAHGPFVHTDVRGFRARWGF